VAAQTPRPGGADGQAASYPARPINLIVPFAPGGGADGVSRLFAQRLGERLGQSIVIENIGGAGGAIGAAKAARAKPDGYTLLAGSPGSMTINSQIAKDVGYDPRRDFRPVAQLTISKLTIVARKDLPVASLKELIELARRKPGELNYGSAGAGSIQHIDGEMFAAQAGIRITHVPYRGTAPALADLVAGRLDIMFEATGPIAGQLRSGAIKAIAVTSGERSSFLPDVPTVSEAGLPGFDSPGSWIGILAPAGTPDFVVERISAEIAAIQDEAATIARLKSVGTERAIARSPIAFGNFINVKYDQIGDLLKKLGLYRSGD